ncbi:MAG: chemotaxis protein CheB [Thermoanaerobaculia bacterium]
MGNRDIIVLGSSAGGVQALRRVIGDLPKDLPAAVFVVQHIAPFGKSAMPAILSRCSAMEARHPKDGEPIRHGTIYVAPPDYHLLIEDGAVRLSRAPTENGHRPAVDVLFRSAADRYGPRVIGVVLTGNLDDGTAGLAAVKRKGGLALVQDPDEADYSGMPTSAMENVDVDHVLRLERIGPMLDRLCREAVDPPADPPAGDQGSPDRKEKLERGEDREAGGSPSEFTCPECGGALWESHENALVHFRCRTGHAYAPESLLAKQEESLEASMWAAVRALEENAAFARRMERWMTKRESTAGQTRYSQRAREAESHAEALRKLLVEETAQSKTG